MEEKNKELSVVNVATLCYVILFLVVFGIMYIINSKFIIGSVNVISMLVISVITCILTRMFFNNETYTKGEVKNIIFKASLLLLLGFVLVSSETQDTVLYMHEKENPQLYYTKGIFMPEFNSEERIIRNFKDLRSIDWNTVIIVELYSILIFLLAVGYLKYYFSSKTIEIEDENIPETGLRNFGKFLVSFLLIYSLIAEFNYYFNIIRGVEESNEILVLY